MTAYNPISGAPSSWCDNIAADDRTITWQATVETGSEVQATAVDQNQTVGLLTACARL